MNHDLESAIELVSAELYSKSEWAPHLEQFDKIGLSIDLYDMRLEVIAEVYERFPELFEDIEYLNDENGMPLWVRPGVTWTPDLDTTEDDD